MSSIAITADLHFGVSGRLQDTLWAARALREFCKHHNVEIVLVLGDMFHDRKSLDIEVASAVCEFLTDTVEKYQQQWIVFPGNHDMFLRHSWKITSLQFLRKYLTVAEVVSNMEIYGKRFWILPFITYERSYMRVLKCITERHSPGDVLLTHIGVRGSILNTCFLLKDWSMVAFDDSPFTRVYTGHFHSKQQIGSNVWYPGSLIPFKFDEGDVPHGFYVYDVAADTHKFYDIWAVGRKYLTDADGPPPPQFRTIIDTELSAQLTDIQHNRCRIALTKDYTEDDKMSMRQQLLDMGALSVRWMYPKVLDTTIPKEPGHIVQSGQEEYFTEWVQADVQGVKDLDMNLLIKLHMEVAQEGDERYVLAEEANEI